MFGIRLWNAHCSAPKTAPVGCPPSPGSPTDNAHPALSDQFFVLHQMSVCLCQAAVWRLAGNLQQARTSTAGGSEYKHLCCPLFSKHSARSKQLPKAAPFAFLWNLVDRLNKGIFFILCHQIGEFESCQRRQNNLLKRWTQRIVLQPWVSQWLQSGNKESTLDSACDQPMTSHQSSWKVPWHLFWTQKCNLY